MKQLTILLAFTTIMLAFVGCDKKEVTGDVNEITLIASANKAEIGDIVTFTVIGDEKDITTNANIYYEEDNNKGTVTDATFNVEKGGIYNFYAQYGDATSSKSILRVKNNVATIPNDPNENNYEGSSFLKRILAVQSTGIGCGYCPYMIKVIHGYKSENNADLVVFAAAHNFGSSVMNNSGGWRIDSLIKPSGYPQMTINLSKASSDKISSNVSVSWINSKLNEHISTNAKTNITVGSGYNASDKTIDVKVNVKFSEEGDFRVSVWLLEDSIYAKQSDYTGLNNDGSMNTHYNVIRGIAPNPGIFASFDNSNLHNANEKDSYSCTFRIGDSSSDNDIVIDDIEKARLVVLTFNMNTNLVDNVVVCPVGFAVPYQYK